MKKLLLLVLTLTASASPPFQEEKLPFKDQPFDHVVKVDVLPVVKKEPIVQNTEEEQGPLMQDEPVADVVEPDSVLLEPETTEEQRVSEKTLVMVEEPVLKADNLTPKTELKPEPKTVAIEMNTKDVPVEETVLEADYQTPETELEPELEIDAIEMNGNDISVEKPVLEADYLTEETPETELEPELEIDAIQMNRNKVPAEEPVLEADYQTPETELEPELEIDASEMNTNNVPVEEPVLEADYLTEETPETELEPELEIDAIEMNRNNVPVEEPVLEADYLTPETELEPELEIDANEMNRNNVPVEEPVLEADYQTPETELEPELEIDANEMNRNNVPAEEPVLVADYLTEETPETELEPEPEIVAIEMNTNNIPVEEPVVEMESVDEMVVESEKEEDLLEKPTLEGDIVVEDPEEVMKPGRERRMTLKTGRWKCRGVVLQGKCYQFFRRTLDANIAELQCQVICPNGHLASVTSSYIREELGKLMDRYGGRTRAWLGGRRMIGTNNFKWLDGAQWSYNNWASGKPNNAGGMENCVEILSFLPFNDVPCDIPKPFICSCPL